MEREHHNGIRFFPIRFGYFDQDLAAGVLDASLPHSAKHGCGHDLGIDRWKTERFTLPVEHVEVHTIGLGCRGTVGSRFERPAARLVDRFPVLFEPRANARGFFVLYRHRNRVAEAELMCLSKKS